MPYNPEVSFNYMNIIRAYTNSSSKMHQLALVRFKIRNLNRMSKKKNLIIYGRSLSSNDFVKIMFRDDEASPRLLTRFRISLMDSCGDPVYVQSFESRDTGGVMRYVMCLDITYSEILENKEKFLVNDCLHLQVLVQIVEPHGDTFSYVPNLFAKQMIAMYEDDEEHSDVVFQVEKDVYKLHSQILVANAPILGELCSKQGNNGSVAPIVLTNVSSHIFDILMRYTYAGELPDENELIRYSKEIIEASDKYVVVNLKMATETCLVQNGVLDESNVCEYLDLAHSKTCPLLKEYAMAFISLHAQRIIGSEGSNLVFESPELMQEVLLNCTNTTPNPFTSRTSCLSVSELREKLEELDLSLDGSKETLIARLEDAHYAESSDEFSSDEE